MAAETQTPVYHYLEIGRLGRGEVVNLFLKDAGIAVKDVRYAYDDTWPATSEKLRQAGITRSGKLPALEYKGKILTQHIPTLRYLARDLGRYDGESNWEKYLVDLVADIYIDWRSQWVASLRGATDEYKNKVVPEYYDLVAKYYSENAGPYLLGDKITYVDFAVYQSYDNEKRTGTLPSKLPKGIEKLVAAVEQRPNIAEYLKAGKA